MIGEGGLGNGSGSGSRSGFRDVQATLGSLQLRDTALQEVGRSAARLILCKRLRLRSNRQRSRNVNTNKDCRYSH